VANKGAAWFKSQFVLYGLLTIFLDFCFVLFVCFFFCFVLFCFLFCFVLFCLNNVLSVFLNDVLIMNIFKRLLRLALLRATKGLEK
jgi:hypothetical protein